MIFSLLIDPFIDFDICFTAVVHNQICNISEVCMYFLFSILSVWNTFSFFFLSFFFFFWLHRAACGILDPQPRIEPVPPAVEEWSLNHWTTREVPGTLFLKHQVCIFFSKNQEFSKE